MSRVTLTELKIKNFRNLSRLGLEPHARFNIVSGANGMGKTNLLEAIYLLGALRSFRTTTRADLIRHGEEGAIVQGLFSDAAAGMECAVEIGATSRRVRVDGKPPARGGNHFRQLPMVLFHPATMGLVQGGPDLRRRFLDRALFQAGSSYPELHRDYLRALAGRNRLLKQEPVDRRALAAFDPQLAELGAAVTEERRRFTEDLKPLFIEAFSRVSDGLEARISYRAKVPGGVKELLAAYRERQRRDEARGYTSAGPHGDDLEIDIGGRPARRFASQGQQRMLALALKIAETRALTTATGRIPVLLLDDVSSELDRVRNTRLFEFLDGVGGQVFITTTHVSHILIEGERADFEVRDGAVTTA
jgi:DNA replication and repair protein RecF